MHRYSLLLALAALIVVALPATSTTLTWYDNRATWETAVGDIFTLIDFTGVATGNYGTSAGVTVGDVQFTGKSSSDVWFLWVSDNNPLNKNLYAGASPMAFSEGIYTPTKGYSSAKFPTGTTYKAVGVDVANATLLHVKENVDNQWVQTTNTTGFVGFISDVGVNQVWFASNTDYNLDNFVFSNGPETPPPDETPDLGTLILCGTGLSLLSFVMRLRKRAKA